MEVQDKQVVPVPDQLSWYIKPVFNVGQKVFFIQYDGPPREGVVRYDQRAIVAIVSQVRDCTTNMGVGQASIVPMGYDLGTIRMLDEPEYYKTHELYTTEESVVKATEWIPVSGISPEEWKHAIGPEKAINDTENSYSDHIEFIAECTEIGMCCASLSEARHMLYKCQRNGGLIRRDVDRLKSEMGAHSEKLEDRPESPILSNIFGQLGILSESQDNTIGE